MDRRLRRRFLSSAEVPELPRNAWRVEEDFIDAILQGRAVTHTHFDDGVRYMQFTEAVQVGLAEGRKGGGFQNEL